MLSTSRIVRSVLPMCRQLASVSSSSPPPSLVDGEWLMQRLNDAHPDDHDLRLLHVSWRGLDAHCSQYIKGGHISSALCFDGAKCVDHVTEYKNMLPTEEEFAAFASSMAIGNRTHVILYDADDNLPNVDPACRAWWTFRAFGHNRVSILDGGLLKWKKEGRGVIKGEAPDVHDFGAPFQANFRPNTYASFEQVAANAEAHPKGGEVLLDCRPKKMFGPKVEDDMQNMRENIGHVRGGINMPFPQLVNQQTKTFMIGDELLELFGKVGVDDPKNTPITSMCHTGMRACALAFSAHLTGNEDNVRVYDGSWYEFSKRADASLKVVE